MSFDDDRWPELDAGDPHMADVVQGVTVYSTPSSLALREDDEDERRSMQMLAIVGALAGLCAALALIVYIVRTL